MIYPANIVIAGTYSEPFFIRRSSLSLYSYQIALEMRNRLFFLIATFVAYLPVFAIQKPIFMLYHHQLAPDATLIDYLQVIGHGLTLDMTIAGYFTIIPALLILLSVWLTGYYLQVLLKGYFLITAILIAAIFSIDIELYSYWGFRLDATPLFYLQTPKEAFASIPFITFIIQSLTFLLYAIAIYCFFWKAIIPIIKNTHVKHRVWGSLSILIFGGLLIFPIRGGLGVATANEGKVYFSSNLFLNHSAVNPCFSLISSLLREQDFASQYNYFSEDERKQIFNTLSEVSSQTDTLKLLSTERPNIILILMESFSSNAIEVLGGETGVTPNLNRLSKEGILFNNFYANSFRTDRGIVSVLNGYPAQPTTSIMKYPAKSQTLPSIAKSLGQAGYQSDMLYGGDINFTHMKSYFFASGYSKITADTDFPLKQRLSKWGVNDDITFSYLFQDIKNRPATSPFFTTFLTLSSHEPFTVPFHHLEDPYLNSIAFTDSCIGSFIDSLKLLPSWNNTLVILLSDHGFLYPRSTKHYEPARQRMPMIWLGGAIKEPKVISAYASQIDLAATLLNQLGLPHSDFSFSKNIFNPLSPKFAFYTYPNGFGFIDSTGITAYDCDSEQILIASPQTNNEERVRKGKAMLQTLYDDLGTR